MDHLALNHSLKISSRQIDDERRMLDTSTKAFAVPAARFGGNGGCAGYDDLALPERWIKCPAYGQA